MCGRKKMRQQQQQDQVQESMQTRLRKRSPDMDAVEEERQAISDFGREPAPVLPQDEVDIHSLPAGSHVPGQAIPPQ